MTIPRKPTSIGGIAKHAGGRPLSTKEKIEARQAARDADSKRKGKKRNNTNPSLWNDILSSGDSSSPKDPEQGVLVRKTAKASKYESEHPAQPGHRSGSYARQEYREGQQTDLMKLPQEVRARIWMSAVVEARFFVVPLSPLGGEQPDLAMTCRQIRAEALPIYYAKNVFAIEVSPSQPRGEFELLQRWVKAVVNGDWHKFINNWAFPYISSWSEEGHDNSLIVSVIVPSSAAVLETDEEPSAPSECADEVEKASPTVEIHKDTFCLMSEFAPYRRCAIQPCPEALNQLVIDALDGDCDTEGGPMLQIARQLGPLIPTLVDVVCVDPMVELYS